MIRLVVTGGRSFSDEATVRWAWNERYVQSDYRSARTAVGFTSLLTHQPAA